jgi:sugar lactone lactonase YvrE
MIIGQGYAFAECLRWHEGRLFFSDIHGGRVIALSEDGREDTICTIDGRPAGLGWLPDGHLIIVEMTRRQLLRLECTGLATHADLSDKIPYFLNDMTIDLAGRAYVGNIGFDYYAGDEFRPSSVWLVTADGEARLAAGELLAPNGSAVTSDGKTLIVGETAASRLTAFTIETDGSLSNRRLWAECDDGMPDGIGLAPDGDVWIAAYGGRAVLRIRHGLGVVERRTFDRETYACAVGGANGDKLFVATATTHDPTECRKRRDSRIEVIDI